MGLREGLKEFFGFGRKQEQKREAHSKRDRASLDASPKSSGGGVGGEVHEHPVQKREGLHISPDENVADFLVRAKEAHELDESKEARFNYYRAGLEAISDRRKQRDIEKYGDNWYGRMWKNLLETDRGISILMAGRAVLGASSIAVAATMLRGDAALFWGPALYAFGSAEYANALLRGTLYFGESKMRSFARAARRETKAVLRELKRGDRYDLAHEELAKIYNADQESLQADKKLKAKELQNNLISFGVPKAIAAALFVHMKAPVPLGWQDFDGKDLPPMEQFHRVLLSLKTGGLYYVQELGNGIAQMGKPIWMQTEEASRFVYGSAAWGVLAGILADVPEKMATATVDMGRKTLSALEKLLGRKPAPKDIEKIRVKPIKGATKKTARFQDPKAARQLDDLSRKIKADAEVWLDDHTFGGGEDTSVGDVHPADAEPPQVPVAGVKVATTRDLTSRTTVKLSEAEKEAMGLPKPVSAQTMKENLDREDLWRPVAEPAGGEKLSDTDRKNNASSVRARIFQAIGLAPEALQSISYRDFNKRLKEFVANDDTNNEQLQTLKEFLEQHTDDLVGEEGAPVLMWADRRHLEKMIEKRLPTEPKPTPPPDQPSEPSEPEEAAYTLEDLIRESEQAAAQKQRERELGGGRSMLRKLLARQMKPQQDIDAVDTWNRREVASGLLRGIHTLTTAAERRGKRLSLRDMQWDLWEEISDSEKWTIKRRGIVKMRKDNEGGWMYRGSIAAPLDPEGITRRARLNINLNDQAIQTLDTLATKFALFYKIGKPGSQNDPARSNATVVVYFPGDKPSTQLLQQLAIVADAHKRGPGQDLPGSKYNNHMYISDQFVGRIPPEQEGRFMETLKSTDGELYHVVRGFLAGKGGIGEDEFNAIKKTLDAFGRPITYDRKRGIVFSSSATQQTAA